MLLFVYNADRIELGIRDALARTTLQIAVPRPTPVASCVYLLLYTPALYRIPGRTDTVRLYHTHRANALPPRARPVPPFFF